MGAPPYLDIDEFAAQYQGALSDGEKVTAERLLQVISDGIRARKVIEADPETAALVVFEVVRDAIAYGHLGPLSSFTNVTAHRQEAGTFDAGRPVDDYLTVRQKRLLGIPVSYNAKPRGAFTPGDY